MKAIGRLPGLLALRSVMELSPAPSVIALVNPAPRAGGGGRRRPPSPLRSLAEENADRGGCDPNNHDGSGKNGPFDGVGDLLRQIFPDIDVPSINLPDLSGLTSSLKGIDIPDVLSPKNENGEKYREVDDFDANLGRDIGEALRLANELASLGKTNDASVREEKRGSYLFQRVDAANGQRLPGRNGAARVMGDFGGDGPRRDDVKGSLFSEADAAVGEERARTTGIGGSTAGRDDGPRRDDVKGSMFRQNDAANWSRGGPDQKQSKATIVGNGEVQSHVNAREDKPSLFTENNAADATRAKSSRAADTSERRTYATSADVKPIEESRQSSGYWARTTNKKSVDTKPIGGRRDQSPSFSHRSGDVQNVRKGTDNGLAAPERKSHNMNSADVKPMDAGRKQSSFYEMDGRQDDGETKRRYDGNRAVAGDEVGYASGNDMGRKSGEAGQFVDAAISKKVRNRPARSNRTRPGRPAMDNPRPKASEGDGPVDAAAAAAKAAWDDASSRMYSPAAPSEPRLDDTRLNEGRDAPFRPTENMGAASDVRSDDAYAIGRTSFGGPESIREHRNDVHPAYDKVVARAREEDARAEYTRWKNYFEDDFVPTSGAAADDTMRASPRGEKGSYKRRKDYSTKVFITESALELARSLKLDVYEIFQYKKREMGLDGEGLDVERAMVGEEDVRDYLDRRYEQLFSVLSMKNDRPRRTPRLPRMRGHSADLAVDHWARNGDWRMDDIDRSLREAREEYFDQWRQKEDANDWREPSYQRYALEQPPTHLLQNQNQRQRQHKNQEREYPDRSWSVHGTYEQGMGRGDNPNTRQTALMHRTMPPTNGAFDTEMRERQHLASVPLSQLISSPKTMQQPPESHDLSNFQQLSMARFSQPYQEQQRQKWNAESNNPSSSYDTAGSPYGQVFQSDHQEPRGVHTRTGHVRSTGDEYMEGIFDSDEYTAHFASNAEQGESRNNGDLGV